MSFAASLCSWSETKTPWFILFLSALALFISALVFQHGFGHAPCIKCIYQRTAVVGIMLAAFLPLLLNIAPVRLLAYIGWAVGAVWGFIIANEHVDIIFAPNPFFAICEFIPNFPSFMPLHEWLPSVFAAPGSCDDTRWQFVGMGMAEWMRIIFAIYSVVWVGVIGTRIIHKKAF